MCALAVRTDILVNGKRQQISIDDRGLLYGDGLFETVRIQNHCMTFSQWHWDRLEKGSAYLGIVWDKKLLKQEIKLLLAQYPLEQAVLKIIITRGIGQRGYGSSNCEQSTRILQLSPLLSSPKDFYLEGVRVFLCDLRLGNSVLAGIKHLNRLEQILARREFEGTQYQEGIVRDEQGFLLEGTMTNLFLVENRTLITPYLNKAGVKGVCRQYLLDRCLSWGITIKEASVTLSRVHQADELFLTNSLQGLWPIQQFNRLSWSVGPVTTFIMKKVAEALHVATLYK